MANETNKDQATVGQDALEKALGKLSALAKSEKDEKQELLQKATSGELTSEENARLLSLLGGGQGQADSLAKSVTAGLQPSQSSAVQQAVDVSEYLNAFHSGALGALEALSDVIEKSDARRSEFEITLAKAIVQVGTLVKSLGDKLDTWSSQTTESPRAARTQTQAAVGKQAVLAKSFVGQEGGGDGDRLSKAEILDLLESMHVDSMKKGMQGAARCGEDLNKSIAKYEQTGKMTRALVEEMQAYRASRAA
jgi:hypothetical protein